MCQLRIRDLLNGPFSPNVLITDFVKTFTSGIIALRVNHTAKNLCKSNFKTFGIMSLLKGVGHPIDT
jgi:hypothetical protein